MGQTFIARVDETMAVEIRRVKELLSDIGMEGITDKQATQVIATIVKDLNYSIQKTSKKIKDKITINLVPNHS